MTTIERSILMARGFIVDNTRHIWTKLEEEVLAALKDLVRKGWKSDNGFRHGYINKLVEALRVEFPGINIKGNPHVCSKLTIWKRNYASIVGMLGRHGVGFNLEGDFKIDARDDEREEICKVDGNAHRLRGKSWPFYEGWKLVFGEDQMHEADVDEAFVAQD